MIQALLLTTTVKTRAAALGSIEAAANIDRLETVPPLPHSSAPTALTRDRSLVEAVAYLGNRAPEEDWAVFRDGELIGFARFNPDTHEHEAERAEHAYDYQHESVIKPGLAATLYFLVVAQSDGDVHVLPVAPPNVRRIGEAQWTNDGDAADDIDDSARAMIGNALPNDAGWFRLDAEERGVRATPCLVERFIGGSTPMTLLDLADRLDDPYHAREIAEELLSKRQPIAADTEGAEYAVELDADYDELRRQLDATAPGGHVEEAPDA